MGAPVEFQPGARVEETPRPAAGQAARFEQEDATAGIRQGLRRRGAGESGPDDGDGRALSLTGGVHHTRRQRKASRSFAHFERDSLGPGPGKSAAIIFSRTFP